MERKKDDQGENMLELEGNARKRYESIRDYRDRYGISPFEDESLKERSPKLYRAVKKTLKANTRD